jgi:DMSO/TMAO reductase YedYZ molybdopterin-dependent catalytic subunit
MLCFVWSLAIVYVYRGLLFSGEEVSAGHEQIDRRQFIVRVGEATAIITVMGLGASLALEKATRQGASIKSRFPWSATHSLPNATATVQPAPGTRPEFTPVDSHYRIDINTMPPLIKESDWRLRVSGLVDVPSEMTLAQLRDGFQPMNQFVTLACISNPVGGSLIGTQRWTGVSLQELIKHWKVKDNATHLKLHAADGFYETVAIDQIKSDPRIMLAYAWDGLPLTPEHGFPLRIYIPDLYGMKQPKWIVSIEAMDHDVPGYWVERGWDKTARMKATSVIDTIATNQRLQHSGQTLIPVGGIAHAGDRGISAVEVKIDDGPWQQAQLRTPISQTTWVVWRYDWPFSPGHHVFKVRCVDGHGSQQIESVAPPDPSGASGIFSKSTDV